jgi:hypothetical protein
VRERCRSILEPQTARPKSMVGTCSWRSRLTRRVDSATTMRMDSKADAPKKPYSTPKLTTYGDIREITHTKGTTGTNRDNNSGRSPNKTG